MFGKDAFNKALDEYMKIRDTDPDSPEYYQHIVNVIKFSKEAISKNKNDGDAHVLLANGYLLAALDNFPGEKYTRYMPLAIAVIHEWKTRDMYTKNMDQGNYVYRGIVDRFMEKHPSWMGVELLSNSIEDIHRDYYMDAVS
jgi:hypothetical protein